MDDWASCFERFFELWLSLELVEPSRAGPAPAPAPSSLRLALGRLIPVAIPPNWSIPNRVQQANAEPSYKRARLSPCKTLLVRWLLR